MSEYQEEITEDVSPHQEAAMREAFGLNESEPEPEDTPDETPEPEEKPEPTPDPEESSAKQHGWTTKAEWVAQGKNPDDWVNAKHFNEKGRLINQARKLESLEKTFDTRINNVKVLYDAQLRTLKSENAQLLQAKKEAVTYGDYEAVQKIDAQLMDNAVNQISINQAAEQVAAPAVPPREDLEKEAAWERENQWINTQDPAAPEFGKAVFTRNLYHQLLQQYPNSTADERIAYVNREVSQKFPSTPKTNPNRDKAPVTDARSARSTSSELTWADLSPDEKQQWNSFGESMFGDKKTFLKAVKDSRRG
jgi:hypothetical protein